MQSVHLLNEEALEASPIVNTGVVVTMSTEKKAVVTTHLNTNERIPCHLSSAVSPVSQLPQPMTWLTSIFRSMVTSLQCSSLYSQLRTQVATLWTSRSAHPQPLKQPPMMPLASLHMPTLAVPLSPLEQSLQRTLSLDLAKSLCEPAPDYIFTPHRSERAQPESERTSTLFPSALVLTRLLKRFVTKLSQQHTH